MSKSDKTREAYIFLLAKILRLEARCDILMAALAKATDGEKTLRDLETAAEKIVAPKHDRLIALFPEAKAALSKPDHASEFLAKILRDLKSDS